MRLDFHRAVKLTSQLDSSVNWIFKYNRGQLETRFVQKQADYIISYVSSHTGCRMGCRFCHLTANGQTSFQAVPIDGYIQQVSHVLDHYQAHAPWNRPAPKRLNVNFMAMGEPLANHHLLNNYTPLSMSLRQLASNHGLALKMNVSTIMPKATQSIPLSDIFRGWPVSLYYSLYSVDDAFRQHWLPQAQPWQVAIDRLRVFQESLGWHKDSQIKLHWAFIEGHNDQPDQVERVACALRSSSLEIAGFNLVRFNPPPGSTHREPPVERLEQCFEIVNRALGYPKGSYMVPRVGPEVYASCGMFKPRE
jgi:adenine C2-methylase RlmN of 23S rRNA A2503 and tRNA A37